MNDRQRSTTDQILDLLLDALQERQQARMGKDEGRRMRDEPEASASAVSPKPTARPPQPHSLLPPQSSVLTPHSSALPPEVEPPSHPPELPERLPSIQLDQMLWRLLLVLIGLVIVINIPFNRYGTNLARAAPDSAALVIRDGLLLKGSGPDVYVLQDNRLRWITTLDAFERYGYRWEQVHEVDDDFLTEFEPGLPIHLLYKCPTSPHVYALEDGRKRWIKDIPTFEAQQYRWEDIIEINCFNLRNIPDGLPIPEDAGPPPQP